MLFSCLSRSVAGWRCVPPTHNYIVRERNLGIFFDKAFIRTESVHLGPETNEVHLTKQVLQKFRADRVKLKRKILAKKLLSHTPELSLLTWRGKQQVLYLSRTESTDALDPISLSSNFPVSPDGVGRIVSSGMSKEKSESPVAWTKSALLYNKATMQNWKLIYCLLSNLRMLKHEVDISNVNKLFDDLPEGLLWVFIQGKLGLLKYSDGNNKFPTPKEINFNELVHRRPRRIGPFESLAQRFDSNEDNSAGKLYSELATQASEINSFIEIFINIQENEPVRGVIPLTKSPESFHFLESLRHIAAKLGPPTPLRKPLTLSNTVNLSFADYFRYKC
ncbi:unnamed protein product [Calicophoron daubneyi]|uniref:Uncharacterized protein n=1 Tax=Calicophoron daubneyi TaxID=300641 RepID=A0AAV2TE21_CALDB